MVDLGHHLTEWQTMRFRLLILATLSGVLIAPLRAQDLAPRAYVITPLHSNAVTLTYSFYDGGLNFSGTIPITGATGTYSVPVFSYYHSFSFFGRSANVLASLPYAVGNFQGTATGAERQLYRSGLLDSVYRFSVNFKGGPAMPVQNFMKWKQKTLLGASLKVVAPTGQYDPTKLINWGSNRWAFKPELGLSRRWGQCVLDTYGAVWLFSTNPDFFSRNQFSPGTNTQSQSPIAAFEGHLSYDFKKGGLRSWISLDGNFWYGGRTSLNGIENRASLQANSRVGATASVPVSKHQSVKFSYSYGAIVRYGGSFQNVSVGWQYSWLGRPN